MPKGILEGPRHNKYPQWIDLHQITPIPKPYLLIYHQRQSLDEQYGNTSTAKYKEDLEWCYTLVEDPSQVVYLNENEPTPGDIIASVSGTWKIEKRSVLLHGLNLVQQQNPLVRLWVDNDADRLFRDQVGTEYTLFMSLLKETQTYFYTTKYGGYLYDLNNSKDLERLREQFIRAADERYQGRLSDLEEARRRMAREGRGASL